MWPNPQIPADVVTFTEEILSGKLHVLCSVISELHTCIRHHDSLLLMRKYWITNSLEGLGNYWKNNGITCFKITMNVHTLSLYEATNFSFEIFPLVIFLLFAANAVSIESSEKGSDSLISGSLFISNLWLR